MRLKADAESFRCDYCQSVYFPEKGDDGVRVLEEPSGQTCPLCKLPLVHAAIANTRISYCTQCRGMSIPMPAFQTLIADLQQAQPGRAAQPAVDSRDLQRKIGCPNCHHRMDTHLYAGPGNVVIDSCEECSLIWLDCGELMHIAHAPDENIAE